MAGQKVEYKGEETGTQWCMEFEGLWRTDRGFKGLSTC